MRMFRIGSGAVVLKPSTDGCTNECASTFTRKQEFKIHLRGTHSIEDRSVIKRCTEIHCVRFNGDCGI